MNDERKKLKDKFRKIQIKLSEHFDNTNKKEVKHIKQLYSIELRKAVRNVEEFYETKIKNLIEEKQRLLKENEELNNNYKLYKELKAEHERISNILDTKYLRQELNRFMTIIDKAKDKVELLEYKDSKLKIKD